MSKSLKKISVDELHMGMYVEQLCCSWIDTPFWQTSFVLDSTDKLDKIRASNVTELWIDISRGCDVAALPSASEAAKLAPTQPLSPSLPPVKPLHLVSAAEEMDRAKRLVEQSRRAVTTMFQEARMGRAVDVDIALAVVKSIDGSVTRNATALIGLPPVSG